MAIELLPLSLPASADASKFQNFGREVKGLHPGKLTPEQFEQIKSALYQVRHVHLSIHNLHSSTRSMTSYSFVMWS